MKLMALFTLITAVFSAAGPVSRTVGIIVVGGNPLQQVDSLEVVGDKLYVGDIQVWPAVARSCLDPAKIDPVHQQQFGLTQAARAEERRLFKLGRSPEAVAQSLAAFFRQHPEQIRDATPGKSAIMLAWKNGSYEEFLLDPHGIVPPDPAFLARIQADTWEQLLAKGCTIYVGDGYELIVPARRQSEVRKIIERAKAGAARQSEAARGHLESKVPEFWRDIRSPQPLDSLRTRR